MNITKDLPSNSEDIIDVTLTDDSTLESGFFKILSGSSSDLEIKLKLNNSYRHDQGKHLWEDHPQKLDIKLSQDDKLQIVLKNTNTASDISLAIMLNIYTEKK